MSNATQTLAQHLESDLGFYVEVNRTSDGGTVYARQIAEARAAGTTSLRVVINHDEEQVDALHYEGFYSIAGSATFRNVNDARSAMRVEAYVQSFLA